MLEEGVRATATEITVFAVVGGQSSLPDPHSIASCHIIKNSNYFKGMLRLAQ